MASAFLALFSSIACFSGSLVHVTPTYKDDDHKDNEESNEHSIGQISYSNEDGLRT